MMVLFAGTMAIQPMKQWMWLGSSHQTWQFLRIEHVHLNREADDRRLFFETELKIRQRKGKMGSNPKVNQRGNIYIYLYYIMILTIVTQVVLCASEGFAP